LILSLLLRQRRAISPVIASLLIITLAIVGGAGISVVLNNIEDNTPNVQSSDNLDNFGSSALTQSTDLDVSISLEKLAHNAEILASEGKKYYTSIAVKLSYSGPSSAPSSLYVIDFDFYVYGVKLDETASWQIRSASGASGPYDQGGNFEGYKQLKGTTATYIVAMNDADLNIIEARIPADASFTYQAKVGTSAAKITHFIINEELSKLVLNPVYYNVSIFHYGQSVLDTTSALNYIDSTINEMTVKTSSISIMMPKTIRMTHQISCVMVRAWGR
jgi:hypothetical protein